MNIGDTLPNFRVPAVTDGHITALDLSQLRGRWTVLSCTQTFGPVETIFLEGQLKRFESYETTLIGLILNDHPFHSSWIHKLGNIRIPLLADPLRRLSRALRCPRTLPPSVCETLLWDSDSCFRFRLIHDLTLHGMNTLFDLLGTTQRQDLRVRAHETSSCLYPVGY